MAQDPDIMKYSSKVVIGAGNKITLDVDVLNINKLF
jgi:hypothetical protein